MRFKLIERLGLNNETSAYIRGLINNILHGEANKVKYKGQTSLLKFLCTAHNISNIDEVCIHHIDFDHENYNRYNICVLKRTDHSYLHNGLISDILLEVLKIQKEQDKAYKNKKQITPQDIDMWFDFDLFRCMYMDAYEQFIDEHRLDK